MLALTLSHKSFWLEISTHSSHIWHCKCGFFIQVRAMIKDDCEDRREKDQEKPGFSKILHTDSKSIRCCPSESVIDSYRKIRREKLGLANNSSKTPKWTNDLKKYAKVKNFFLQKYIKRNPTLQSRGQMYTEQVDLIAEPLKEAESSS